MLSDQISQPVMLLSCCMKVPAVPLLQYVTIHIVFASHSLGKLGSVMLVVCFVQQIFASWVGPPFYTATLCECALMSLMPIQCSLPSPNSAKLCVHEGLLLGIVLCVAVARLRQPYN